MKVRIIDVDQKFVIVEMPEEHRLGAYFAREVFSVPSTTMWMGPITVLISQFVMFLIHKAEISLKKREIKHGRLPWLHQPDNDFGMWRSAPTCRNLQTWNPTKSRLVHAQVDPHGITCVRTYGNSTKQRCRQLLHRVRRTVPGQIVNMGANDDTI